VAALKLELIETLERQYDPETGRWLQRDPIGFAGHSTNLYGYVMNDPINFVDPNGQFPTNPDEVALCVYERTLYQSYLSDIPFYNNLIAQYQAQLAQLQQQSQVQCVNNQAAIQFYTNQIAIFQNNINTTYQPFVTNYQNICGVLFP
jgi:uncharacterized protein RhaS with RHS repeats